MTKVEHEKWLDCLDLEPHELVCMRRWCEEAERTGKCDPLRYLIEHAKAKVQEAATQKRKERSRQLRTAAKSIREGAKRAKAVGTYEPKSSATRTGKAYMEKWGMTPPCQHCGTTEHMSIDHIIPISKGGTNALANLQPLCLPCNIAKGDR